LQTSISAALARSVQDRHGSAGNFARTLMEAVEQSRPTPAVAFRGIRPPAASNRTLIRAGAAAASVAALVILYLVLKGIGSGSGDGTTPLTLASADDTLYGGATANRDSLAALARGAGATGADSGSGAKVTPPGSQKSGGAAGTTGARGSDGRTAGAGAGAATGGATTSGGGAAASGGGGATTSGADAQLQLLLNSITLNTDITRITEQSATQALADIERALPQLRSRTDSAGVEVQRIEALIFLNRHPEACRYIDALLPRANSGDIRALRDYRTNLMCRG
jgi:hypothetical protein